MQKLWAGLGGLFTALALTGYLVLTAEATTGNEMLLACSNAESALVNKEKGKMLDLGESLMAGVCLGHVTGIKFFINTATQNTDYPVCVPANATNGQVLAVVARYLRNHPEMRAEDFNYLVTDALHEVWPCKR
jgi:hypothetical protein